MGVQQAGNAADDKQLLGQQTSRQPLALVPAPASSPPSIPGEGGRFSSWSFKSELRSEELWAQQDMKTIANQIVALNAKINSARQLVAEHQMRAQGLRGGDDGVSKSFVLIHDLTHWLHSLEARRDDLFRQSRLRAQRRREVA